MADLGGINENFAKKLKTGVDAVLSSDHIDGTLVLAMGTERDHCWRPHGGQSR
jgi:hypothetical protein